MRGVSERVGGPDGVGCGKQRRGRRGSQDVLAPGPTPRPRGEAAAGAGRCPLLNSWPRPRGLREERKGRREGPAGGLAEPRVSPSRVRAAGDGRGRAGPQGGRPADLKDPREQKETATAPPWSKQPALAAAQGPALASEPFALTLSLPPLPPSCLVGGREGRCGLPASAEQKRD